VPSSFTTAMLGPHGPMRTLNELTAFFDDPDKAAMRERLLLSDDGDVFNTSIPEFSDRDWFQCVSPGDADYMHNLDLSYTAGYDTTSEWPHALSCSADCSLCIHARVISGCVCCGAKK